MVALTDALYSPQCEKSIPLQAQGDGVDRICR